MKPDIPTQRFKVQLAIKKTIAITVDTYNADCAYDMFTQDPDVEVVDIKLIKESATTEA